MLASTFIFKVSASVFFLKMGRPGFEPGTNRLKAECSTVELATLLLQFATFPIYHQQPWFCQGVLEKISR